jgi:hypothetical protein
MQKDEKNIYIYYQYVVVSILLCSFLYVYMKTGDFHEHQNIWSNFMFWNYEILKLAQISVIKYS